MINVNYIDEEMRVFGRFGECEGIYEIAEGRFLAVLYIRDNDFDESEYVSGLFHKAGADDVMVSHVLYNSGNDYRYGMTIDGARVWIVNFSMP